MKTNIFKYLVMLIGVSLILSSCTKKAETIEPENNQPMSYLFGGSVSYGANNRLSINNLDESPMDKQIPYDGAYYAVSYRNISGTNYKFNNFLKIGQINLNNATVTSAILGDTSKIEILISALESEIIPGTYPIYDLSAQIPMKNVYKNSFRNTIYDKVFQPLNTTSATALYSRNVIIRTENISNKTSTDNGILLDVSGSVTITSYDKVNQLVSGNYSFTQSVYLNTLKGATVLEVKGGAFKNIKVQKF